MKISECGALELLSVLDELHMPVYGFLCANAKFITDRWLIVVCGNRGWFIVERYLIFQASFIKEIGGLKDVYQD